MGKRKWKRKAKDLREALRLSEELAAMSDERAAQYLDDFDSLWDIVGEEPGDRNDLGVRNLAVVLERRMAELREWRYGWRSPEPSVFGPMIPEPEARVCRGIAWDVCRRWMMLDTEEPFPCATMTGCWGRVGVTERGWSGPFGVWWQCQHEAEPYLPPHVRPCGVMS